MCVRCNFSPEMCGSLILCRLEHYTHVATDMKARICINFTAKLLTNKEGKNKKNIQKRKFDIGAAVLVLENNNTNSSNNNNNINSNRRRQSFKKVRSRNCCVLLGFMRRQTFSQLSKYQNKEPKRHWKLEI